MSNLFERIREKKREAEKAKAIALEQAKVDMSVSKPLQDDIDKPIKFETLGDITALKESQMQKRLKRVKTNPFTTVTSYSKQDIINAIEDDSDNEPEKRSEIVLDDVQKSAIEMAINNDYCNLIGYAGTGKTTTVLELVKALIDSEKIRKTSNITGANNTEHLARHQFNFAMVAFTGLAVKTLRRVVPNEFKANCNTIHKLIDFGPVKRVIEDFDEVNKKLVVSNKTFFEPRCHNGKWVNSKGYPCSKDDKDVAKMDEEPKLLPFDQIIIDEISMCGVGLLRMLLDALPEHCRIITIGDLAQLQPVLDRAIHPVLLNKWPTTELTKIYRQKEGDVITNANLIRQGKIPSASDNFKVLGIDKNENKAAQQVMAHIKKCYDDGSYDPEQDILICPTNAGTLGQEMFNIKTRNIVNPSNDIMLIKTMRNESKFAVGDRVMNVKNDNDLGVYNGMLGWINHIAPNVGISGKHYANANLTSKTNEFTGQTFDLESELKMMEEKQKADRQRAKVNSIMGGGLFKEIADGGNDNKEETEGTGVRKASHNIEIQFDYMPEDDPDGYNHLHLFETSSQIENLKLAYWITIHKSQGSGFRNVFICLHDSHGANFLCNELLYTAVTRCMENVTLMTTKYALTRCVKNMRIKGSTMAEKIDSYCAGFDYSSISDINIPDNS